MLDAVIQDLIRQQRPYYLPQGNPIKGVGSQYWLTFQHRDADKGGNFLKNINAPCCKINAVFSCNGPSLVCMR